MDLPCLAPMWRKAMLLVWYAVDEMTHVFGRVKN
jgi:hypothetical protein